MKNKTLVVGSVILALIFIALACFYWITPADALPSYFPGYDATSTVIHFKHGLASLLLALALCVFAWFKSAGKSKHLQ
jgi:hypothetical protein